MRRRFLVQVFGLPVVLGFLWLGAIWYPMIRSERGLSSELAVFDRQRAAQGDQLSLLRLVAENHEELVMQQMALTIAIPPVGDVGAVLAALDSAAADTGISIENVTPSSVVTTGTAEPEVALPGGVSAISLRLAGSGDYAAVLDFVESVTTMSRLVLVDDVSMFARAQETNVLSMTLDLRVFTTGSATDGDSAQNARPESLAFDESQHEAKTPFVTTQEALVPWITTGPQRNPFVLPTAKSDRELFHEDAADGVASTE